MPFEFVLRLKYVRTHVTEFLHSEEFDGSISTIQRIRRYPFSIHGFILRDELLNSSCELNSNLIGSFQETEILSITSNASILLVRHLSMGCSIFIQTLSGAGQMQQSVGSAQAGKLDICSWSDIAQSKSTIIRRPRGRHREQLRLVTRQGEGRSAVQALPSSRTRLWPVHDRHL